MKTSGDDLEENLDDLSISTFDDLDVDSNILDEIEGIFRIEKIFSSMENYLKCKDTLKKRILTDFSERKDSGTLIVDEKEYSMSLGKILLNILLMKPFAELGLQPSSDDIIEWSAITQDLLNDYFNKLVRKFRSSSFNIDYNDIRRSILEAMNEMSDLSGENNIRLGNSISYRDLIRLQVEDPKFNELTHRKVKPGQFSDIEGQFNTLGKDLMKYFASRNDSELNTFITSETRN